ncbi:MAG: HlyD family secretion protein [Methylacidiphilales bacterium]|nr:HlyD family secretion protein [Candidatus Methylacidiphilales bacterium]
MKTTDPTAPEFKEGFQSGFQEGFEQARRQSKENEAAVSQKKEESKEKSAPPRPNALRQAVRKMFGNRIFQVVAAIVTLVLLAYFLYDASIHESSDDAYTEGHIHNISSRVTGTVIAVRVDDNQLVHQGDVLVELDPTDYKVQVDQARADFQKAQADLARGQALQGQGAISKQDFDTFDSACKVAAAKLEDAENQLSYCTIRAPSDGRIGHKTVETGNRLEVGAALMAVVEDVWVVANFKETQLADMRPGQPAEIEIDAVPDKQFRGVVDSWSPGSGATFALLPPDNATGNFTKIVQRVPVKIRFDADSIRGYENRIVPGLSCETTVLLRGGEANRSTPIHPQTESIPITVSR